MDHWGKTCLLNCACKNSASSPSEGFTLRILGGAGSAVALHSHGVVVERWHAWQAARQAGHHVTTLAVRANTVVAVDVGGLRHGFLQVLQTHTRTCSWSTCLVLRTNNNKWLLVFKSNVSKRYLIKHPPPSHVAQSSQKNSTEISAMSLNFFCLLLFF